MGCAAVHQARYPSWEPTSVLVPTVPDRDTAKAYLAESLKVWRRRFYSQSGPRTYSYVRARDVAVDRVEFTVISVVNGHMIERALVVEDPTAKNSVMRLDLTGHADMHVEWDETGSALGSHIAGAPLRTVDDLYGECNKLIAERPASEQIRMYFDPAGILQHCGFLDLSPSTSYVSIQNVGETALGEYWPSSILCARPEGLYLEGNTAADGMTCGHGFRKKPGSKGPDYSECPEEAGKCYIEGTHCDVPPGNFANCNGDNFNICERFPGECGIREEAQWFCRNPPTCYGSQRSQQRELGPLELGKASPFEQWVPHIRPDCRGLCAHRFGA